MKKTSTVVIVGGGFAGLELINKLANNDQYNIILVDGQDAVLSSMSKKSQKYTYEKLVELKVNVVLNTYVQDFDNDIVYLSNGKKIDAHNLIWAAGVIARKFKGFKKESYGPGNRLKTDEYNLVEGYSNIYMLLEIALSSYTMITIQMDIRNWHNPQYNKQKIWAII